MNNLRELQVNFQNYLLQEDPEINSIIVGTDTTSAATRLEVYRHAYHLRLLKALQEDYPVLLANLGVEMFQNLVRDYVTNHPSSFRNLRWYGKDLIEFMQTRPSFLEQPWLIEMATFEWSLTEVFDAADSSELTVTEMMQMPYEQWAELRFILNSSLRQLNLLWNIVSIWKAYRERQVLPKPQLEKASTQWILWRRNNEVQFCSLSNVEAYMLETMAGQNTLGSICVGLCQWFDEAEVATQTASLLKRFISDGLIAEKRI